MPQDSDRGYYFQSSASDAQTTRRAAKSSNTFGRPIRLPAKISAICADPFGAPGAAAVYVADSGGVVRRIDVDSQKTTHTYRGPSAPLTSLALLPAAASSPTSNPNPRKPQLTLFAGCWDQKIYAWDAASRALLRTYSGAHTDFVKSVAVARVSLPPTTSTSTAASSTNTTPAAEPTDILLSGGADGRIAAYRVDTGAVLAVTSAHSRGVLDLAVDPASYSNSTWPTEVTLFSASSLGEIRRWRVGGGGIREVAGSAMLAQKGKKGETNTEYPLSPLTAHETSVNRLHFPAPPYPAFVAGDGRALDLYTASSDNTARVLARRTHYLTATPKLPHPDWVRDVAADPGRGLVATACRDEEIRIWEVEYDEDMDEDAGVDGGEATTVVRAGGEATAELVGVLSGHWDSIEAIAFVAGASADAGAGARRLVSGGMDCTVRVWSVERGDVERCGREWRRWARKHGVSGDGGGDESEDDSDGKEEGGGAAVRVQEVVAETGSAKVLATDEEDAELAALMAELDDD